jgi:hypothetical protein
VDTHPIRRQAVAVTTPARDLRARHRCLALLRAAVCALAFALCIGPAGPATTARADSTGETREHMQGLDEQVQEIKSDVLHIASELRLLEEKLLYPSDTQVAVFVSLADAGDVRLDSLQVQIDGELVAHHIYSFKELEALQKGGVQRIYTGNLPTGEHRLDVSVAGKLAGGGDFGGAETFSFSKDVEPKLVDIRLDGGGSGAPSIRLGR